MKKYFTIVMILVIVLMLACSAGCSSKETPSQRESIERPSVALTTPALNADRTIAQNDRNIPTPSITHPMITQGSTIPVPAGTMGSIVYENVSEIVVTAQEISAAWDPDGLACSAKSCTAGFVNNNGDRVQVRTTLYDSVDSAKTGYNEEKLKDAAYRVIPLDIPDESYGWMQKSQSKVIFRKNNAVVIVDYTSYSGPASITIAKEFAGLYSQNI